MFKKGSVQVSSYNELELIEFIKNWLGPTCLNSPKGIGDDCAIFDPKIKTKYLISTDSLIYKKHFDNSTKAKDVGRKLVLRNLSDIAAMGGLPEKATIAICTSKNLSLNWLKNFYLGVKSSSIKYGLKIVGGDLAQSDDKSFQATMTIVGSTKNPILRHNSKIGNMIYVTGKLGGSILKKHYSFTPRIKEASWIANNNFASSMTDVSDGIIKELRYLLKVNSSASIDLEKVPISSSAERLSNNIESALEKAFSDGEDYELLFTLENNISKEKFEEQWGKKFPTTKLTNIGKIVKRFSHAEIINNKTNLEIKFKSSFDHFSR